LSKPLLILDTNVVLDLLYFDDAMAQPLRHAMMDGHVHCAVTDATFGEWLRVLGYPEFALDPMQQAALAERYRELSTLLAMGATASGLPRCSDADDQKFIELAAAARADALISKDRALLKLRRRCAPWFQVMTPAEAAGWLDTALR
jgi:putative PIN family toxin of toxin-antitoxin system